MPGVLIIEAMAQATGILAFKSEVGRPEIGQIYMLVGVDKVRFKRIVEPGDQLEIYAEVITVKRGMWKFSCTAKVDGELVTSILLLKEDLIILFQYLLSLTLSLSSSKLAIESGVFGVPETHIVVNGEIVKKYIGPQNF